MATIKSIEEKAKAYDEVVSKLKGFMMQGVDPLITRNDVQDFFPELAESEDERIRKEIIAHIKWCEDSGYCAKEEMTRWIAWLEKHAKFINGIQVGDKVTRNEDGVLVNLSQLNRVAKKQGEQKLTELTNSQFVEKCKGLSDLEKYILSLIPTRPIDAIKVDARTIRHLVEQEQKSADKLEPKFEIGDVMRTLQEAADGFTEGMPMVVSIDEEYYHCTNELIAIKDQDDYEYPPMNRRQKPAWSEEDEKQLNDAIDACKAKYGNMSYTADWLKSIKDRVLPQPKQEWSKEDENNILFLTSIIEECFKDKKKITLCGDTVCANFTKEDVINRLKSLSPKSHWKPSDEQIHYLSWIANIKLGDSVVEQEVSKHLNELLEDLKKLRGE